MLDFQVLQTLEEETGSDVILDLLKCFSDDTQKRKLDIERAILDGDNTVLAMQAHSLGSSAAAFGGTKLHLLCRNVETLLKGKDEDAAFCLAKDFSKTIDDTLQHLSDYKYGLHPDN